MKGRTIMRNISTFIKDYKPSIPPITTNVQSENHIILNLQDEGTIHEQKIQDNS